MSPLSRDPGRERWNASCAATISERQNERDKFKSKTTVFTITVACAESSAIPKPRSSRISASTRCSNRGQESAGIGSSDGRETASGKSHGLVADIFQPEVLARLPGDAALGHTRYSTAGDTVADERAAHRYRLQQGQARSLA